MDEIKISVDGASKEEFERIRFPLKFDVVMENVQRLVELRDRAGSHLKIFITCCSTSDKRGTRRMLPGRIDGLVFGKIHNWTGPDAGTGPRGIRKPCARLWRTLTVLANGDVALCCLDYDGQHLLGHIDAGTLAPRRLAGAGLPGDPPTAPRRPAVRHRPLQGMLEVVPMTKDEG